MQLEPPRFDESKNPNISHDPYQFSELRALSGYLLLTLLAVWLAVEAAVYALPYTVGIERERQWFGFIGEYLVKKSDAHQDHELQQLADRLAQHMDLPPQSVTVYISESEIPNAYATFGGNVVMYRGLLQRLPSEQSVAAVLAHEMGHIRHRDPLRGMTRSLLYSAVAAAFGSETQIDKLATLEGLRYSRDMEEQADNHALNTLQAHYQNVQGMVELFETVQKIEQGRHKTDISRPTWLSTHPDTADRLQNVHRHIRRHPRSQPYKPLPNRWQTE